MFSIDLEFVLSHWPFFVVAFALGVLGETFKTLVKPYDNAYARTFRRTLPLHAPAAGAAIGALGWLPCPEEFCANAHVLVLYGAAAGLFSSYVYAAIKHMAKTREKSAENG